MIESDVAMVGLVVLVMLWDKWLRHRVEMTQLKQKHTLTKKDVLEIIEGAKNQTPETDKEIKIFK